MKILVIGATGYVGAALSRALRADGLDVGGLARSEASAARLASDGFSVFRGDFLDPPSLAAAVAAADPDVVVATASAGGGAGDTAAFSADRRAIQALAAAMEGRGKTLVFTSGSAVFGVFADGDSADPAFPEDTPLPLPRAVFAPPSAEVAEVYAADLQAAIAARIDAEQAVLQAPGVRGMIIRPANIYGYGGSVDAPKYIELALAAGCAPYWGAGGSLQSYVHLDDVVGLYRLAMAQGRPGGVYHAASEEVAQKDLAAAIGRMIGASSQSVTLDRMNELGGTRGVRLSLNKRLSSEKTRVELGWAPRQQGVLREVEFGSYAERYRPVAPVTRR